MTDDNTIAECVEDSLGAWLRHFPPSTRARKISECAAEIVSDLDRQGFLANALSQPAPVVGLGDGWSLSSGNAIEGICPDPDMPLTIYVKTIDRPSPQDLREFGERIGAGEIHESLLGPITPPSSRSPAPALSREEVARIIWDRWCSRHGGPWSPGPSGSAETMAGADCLNTADAVLALLPQEAAGRAGWRWVPEQPDGAMEAAGLAVIDKNVHMIAGKYPVGIHAKVWRAMIAAAPVVTPSPDIDPAEVEAVARALAKLNACNPDDGFEGAPIWTVYADEARIAIRASRAYRGEE